ncbi:MAG: phage major capsid protein, partial [Bacteroidales bacterium]
KPLDAASQTMIFKGREQMRSAGRPYSGQITLPIETRATLQAQAANSGGEIVGQDVLPFSDVLRANLVLLQAGATFLPGLVGDCSIPAYAGTSALWKGEVAAAVDGAGATDEVTLSPKRLTAFITISKMFLAQDSNSANEFLMNDLLLAVSDKLESTILGKAAGSATQPAGLFVDAPTIKGSASWGNILSIESAIFAANALKSGCKYITNAAGRGLLKATPKVANQAQFIIEPDGTMNGYPVLVSNHIATGLQVGANEDGIIFGDFSQLVIGNWGSIDLTIDPYSNVRQGEVVITVNAYFDAALRHSAALKTASLKA